MKIELKARNSARLGVFFLCGLLLIFGSYYLFDRAVIVALGVIGLWRYCLQLLHIIRNWMYAVSNRKRFSSVPSLSYEAYSLVIIVADYKINQVIREKVLESLSESIAQLKKIKSVDVIFNSEFGAPALNFDENGREVRYHQLYQKEGKRSALADSLEYASGLDLDDNNTIVCLMDGDTALDTGVLEDTLAAFSTDSSCSALTTNQRIEIPEGNNLVKDWYELKFSKRNHYMKSHALSKKVMTLTGRYSAFDSSVAFQEGFISSLREDKFRHWLFGETKFVMGDDKTTCYEVQKVGGDMLYLPDTYVTNYDEVGDRSFLSFSMAKMSRWYGNMIRNSPRTIGSGTKYLPPFIWYCYLDQLISCFTTLIGPMAALILFCKFGVNMLITYAGFVLVTRSFQLTVLAFQGHQVKFRDLLLLLYDQWLGSLVKIFCIFFPHIQSFALRDEHKAVETREHVIKYKISYYLMVLTLFAQMATVYIFLVK